MNPKITSRRAHHFALGLLRPGAVVIDLGANRGFFSSELLDLCDCTCYAIEAVPELCRSIPQRNGLKAFNLAICERSGPVRFNVSSKEESGSMSDIPDAIVAGSIEVEGVTLKSFLLQNRITCVDLLKMDIEGAEIGLLLSMDAETLKMIRQITVEFHDFLPYFHQKTDILLIKDKLKKAGFVCIKYSMRCNADVLFINRSIAGLGAFQIARLKWFDRYWRAAQRFLNRRGATAA
jgi:FkbM family methyltransferase